ncbi:MAG TPA: methyltransferase domain-containing protein [Anaerolineales bacterium]|nr:methyltransferase domain-containing protein [Anaerolineales bacterium]HLO27483.1 methyltransferase domain-containing protein [Anaerolineales bacterium]
MDQNDPSEAMERKQAIAGVFHRASATYDHVGPSFFAYFGRKLVEHAALPLGARVLDVASGRGAVLFPAAEAVGRNGSVVGIDFAEGMAKETTQEAARRGLSHVQVRQMDAEHLDFPDSSFDAVLCGFAIFFFPQLERALGEFHRTLKPGGRIAVSTWGNLFDKDWEWFDALIEKYLPPKSQETQTSGPSDRPDFDKPEGMEKIMKAAGFTGIQVLSEIADFTYAAKEEWWESLWSHGGRASLERIEKNGGHEALAQFKTESLEQISARKDSKGFQQSFHVLYTLAAKPL